MMKKIILVSLLLINAAIQVNAQSTWNDNVACIIYSHCTNCHNSNGIGFGDFTNYQNAKNSASSIGNAVSNKRMPPYPPSEYQRYTHERKLSADEIAQIQDWVSNGAPQGSGTAPTPPVYNPGSTIVNPDLVVKIPTYTVNTASGDVYRCFPIPINLGSDKYIAQVEVVPGNRKVVHHVLVFQDSSNVPLALDAAAPGPGYNSAGTGSNASTLISAWVPGQEVTKYPPNFGVRVKGVSNIVVQIHYPGGIINDLDSTQVVLKFATSAVRPIIISPIINHSNGSLQNGPLAIPANTIKTFEALANIPVNATVLSVTPHMHKVGTSFKVFNVSNSNDTIPLIDIPKWDFNWQGSYNFRKLIKIPAGSKARAYATYNNTTSNPYNPNNPPALVTLGEATNDEMLLCYFSYTSYLTGDENIIIDTNDHLAHFNNCSNTPTSITYQELKNEVKVYPNPFADNIEIKSSLVPIKNLAIYNLSGAKVFAQTVNNNSVLINTSSLVNGLYQIRIEDEAGNRSVKMVSKQ
jgi:hypothetical protein